MSGFRGWWSKIVGRGAPAEQASDSTVGAREDLLAEAEYVDSPSGSGISPPLGPNFAGQAVLDRPFADSPAAPVSDASGAISEDFPELGIQDEAPADTGAALEKDVAEHAPDVEKWREEDEKAGRTED